MAGASLVGVVDLVWGGDERPKEDERVLTMLAGGTIRARGGRRNKGKIKEGE
jgi:hypothetical protein